MSVEHLHAVPHLTTALSGPLHDIESHLLTHQARIEAWFRSEWVKTPAPFYASVDLRNAGFKLAPVDTNLFPAGFNNLNEAFMPLCIQAAQAAIERVCPDAAKVLIIPESHTRNPYYLESVATLTEIIRKGGFEVRIASLNEELPLPQTIELDSGRSVRLEKPERRDNRLTLGDFDPCVVLLNNDLSGGRPAILESLEQKVIPPLNLGWADRLKSEHFAHYRSVAQEFARMAEIDPWFIDPLFRNCGEINFMKREGEECLHKNVTRLLNDIQQKYDEYNIDKALLHQLMCQQIGGGTPHLVAVGTPASPPSRRGRRLRRRHPPPRPRLCDRFRHPCRSRGPPRFQRSRGVLRRHIRAQLRG
ncbi:MAG: glutamate--cysteine ligase [Desulfurivibrionaceae bacterium]